MDKSLAKLAAGVLLAVGLIHLGNAAGLRAQDGTATGHPSAKATSKIGATTFLTTADTWTTILSNTIKTSNQKDLFMCVSLVSALATSTTAKSKNGETDTESANAGVEVRVLVDGVPAAPGSVVFAKRKQTLSAKLQGIISGALTQDAEGNLIIDPTLVTEEEITLILETMSANAFGFVMGDVVSGVHRVEVQVMIQTGTSSSDAAASALVGPGSLTVESVRMIKGEDILLE